LDNTTDDFIIEYLINGINKECCELISDSLRKFGINYILKKNKIIIENKFCGNIYKWNAIQPLIQEKNEKNEDIKYIIGILSILFSIYGFEKNFLTKLKNSEKQIDSNNNVNKVYTSPNINRNYLINKKLFDLFKIMFSYSLDKMEYFKMKCNLNLESDIEEKPATILNIIIKEDENYINMILKKKNEFFQKFGKNFFIIENSYYKSDDHESLFILKNFDILNTKIFLKFIEILKLRENDIKLEEIIYYYNSGKIILKINKSSFNNNNNLIYIYSLKKENNDLIKYLLEGIISFDDAVSMINKFSKLNQEGNILKKLQEIPYTFESNYKCKIYLLNKNNQEKLILYFQKNFF